MESGYCSTEFFQGAKLVVRVANHPRPAASRQNSRWRESQLDQKGGDRRTISISRAASPPPPRSSSRERRRTLRRSWPSAHRRDPGG